ncbi:hypothetical protein PG984_011396 [Apiospora sp. TS-2023a]
MTAKVTLEQINDLKARCDAKRQEHTEACKKYNVTLPAFIDYLNESGLPIPDRLTQDMAQGGAFYNRLSEELLGLEDYLEDIQADYDYPPGGLPYKFHKHLTESLRISGSSPVDNAIMQQVRDITAESLGELFLELVRSRILALGRDWQFLADGTPWVLERNLSDESWQRASLSMENKAALELVADLLSSRQPKIISPCPFQMGVISYYSEGHDLLESIVAGVHDLRLASDTIATNITKIYEGQSSYRRSIEELLSALDDTYKPEEQMMMFDLVDETHDHYKLIHSLQHWDARVRNAMVRKILHAALILAKFTALATCLTVVMAHSMGIRGGNARHATIKDDAATHAVRQYTDLHALYKRAHDNNHPFAPASSNSRYSTLAIVVDLDNSPKHVANVLKDGGLIEDGLNKLRARAGWNDDLVESLASPGHHKM